MTTTIGPTVTTATPATTVVTALGPPPPVIELRDVHVLFRHNCALDLEDLRVLAGERLFVLGRSGSGKSTLARLIKGRLRPSTGEVRVLGQDLTKSAAKDRRLFERRVAMIDQEFYLVPRMSVVANVLSGCLGRVSWWKSLGAWYPASEWDKALSILREVDLEEKAGERVETLSGGQRQRAAIARALMQEADIILADEPISNLDPELAEEALELLVDCVERRGVTLVVNLHQPSLARQFASRLLGLSQGKKAYDGPPERFTARDAEFLYGEDGARPQAAPGHEKDTHEEPAAAVASEALRSGLRLVRG